MKTIYLAGGCFWGTEKYFKSLKGVEQTQVGYAQGNYANPAYEDLKKGKATHAETVKVDYDEKVIDITKLLEHFLRFVDPFSVDRQGEDYGHQYRSGVYLTSLDDLKEAENYLKIRSQQAGKPFKIEVHMLNNFSPAEEYHQDYLDKHPNGYCHVNLNLIKPEEHK
jgi:methionine-S-sulfoxide reductase